MRWPKGPSHLALNPPYFLLLVFCVFLSFPFFASNIKTCFPPKKDISVYLSVSPFVSLWPFLAFFGLPLFTFSFFVSLFFVFLFLMSISGSCLLFCFVCFFSFKIFFCLFLVFFESQYYIFFICILFSCCCCFCLFCCFGVFVNFWILATYQNFSQKIGKSENPKMKNAQKTDILTRTV